METTSGRNGVGELEVERNRRLIQLLHDDGPIIIELEGPEIDHHLILVNVRHDRALELLVHRQLFDASVHVEVQREVDVLVAHRVGADVDLRMAKLQREIHSACRPCRRDNGFDSSRRRAYSRRASDYVEPHFERYYKGRTSCAEAYCDTKARMVDAEKASL